MARMLIAGNDPELNRASRPYPLLRSAGTQPHPKGTMNNFAEAIWKLLRPRPAAVVALVAVSAAGLAWCFLLGGEGTPLSYAVYLLSTYALAVVIIRAVPVVRAAWARAMRVRVLRTVVENEALRSGASGAWSVAFDLAYAAFTLATGLAYDSGWAVSVALYHVAIAGIGFSLAFGFARARRLENTRRRVRELKMARTCGVVLTIMALALTGVMVHIIGFRKAWVYDEVTVITIATFTFVSLASAIVGIARVRKIDSPALAASRSATLSKTIVQVFFLETTMIAVFGEPGAETFRFAMETATGAVVFVFVLGIAVGLVAYAVRGLRTPGPAGK